MAWKPLTVTGLIGFSLLAVGHTAPPRGVYSLIPGTCEDVMLHGNWDSARVIKVTGLRFEHEPGLSRWVSITGGLPWRLSDKESACDAGDPDSIPESGRYPGEGNGNPLQYSGLENPMDRGAWRAVQSLGSQRCSRRDDKCGQDFMFRMQGPRARTRERPLGGQGEPSQQPQGNITSVLQGTGFCRHLEASRTSDESPASNTLILAWEALRSQQHQPDF